MTAPAAASLRETIRLGYVARAHGLAGEVEVRLDWPEGEGLKRAQRLVLEAPDGTRREFEVKLARPAPKGFRVRLGGVSDRDGAEALRGHIVSAARDMLPQLEAGEYYLCDLVGAEVITPEGVLGRVIEVQVYPSVDAVVIESAAGERFEQPLLDEWIAEVSALERRVVLRSAAGLIEIPRKPARELREQSEG